MNISFYKIEFIYLFDSEEFQCFHHNIFITERIESLQFTAVYRISLKSIQAIIFISLANQKYHFT